MKKKTLAAASLLLALLMPLGATPLAVYADETPAGVSTVSEDPEGTGETNKDPKGTGNGNTNDGSEADAPEVKEETVAPVLLDAADTGLDDIKTFSPDDGDILNKRTGEVYAYADFEKAVTEAKPEDELELGVGTYSLYDIKSDYTTKDKILTFIGQGPDKTLWRIGAKVYPGKSGEYNSDYSFQGSQSVTFKNMKLYVPYDQDYLGFSHTNVTVVEDCIIEGRTAYWGYKRATFKHTIFNAPAGNYAIWTYSSPEMTFDNCTFNASGKVINVYTDAGAEEHNVTVNFNSCTVNSTTANKTALSINDSLMTKADKGFRFYVNITGNNTINGLDPDKVTCSRLFGFGNDKVQTVGGYEYHYDSGATVVTINGKPVWEDAARNVEHNGNNFEGTYNNGTDSGSANQYTEGYKDGKVYNVYGGWSGWTEDANVPHLYRRARTVTEKCRYCNYSKLLDPETETKQAFLLHYDLNGGTGAEGADYSDHYYFEPKDGNTATVAAAPSRAGYQFAGWQDADGKQYAAGDAVTVDHNITLTAQWNKLVTVSFDLCGHGGANISSQTFVSGNKASEPTAPKEDGWVFGGWYTEKGCKYRFSFDSAVTSDIILYAKWDRVTTVVSAPVATPTPSPAPAAAATKTATVKNAAIPQTSDAFPMEGLLALLAVGAVGFGAAGWLRKKHH